jgi:hypothetical protein
VLRLAWSVTSSSRSWRTLDDNFTTTPQTVFRSVGNDTSPPPMVSPFSLSPGFSLSDYAFPCRRHRPWGWSPSLLAIVSHRGGCGGDFRFARKSSTFPPPSDDSRDVGQGRAPRWSWSVTRQSGGGRRWAPVPQPQPHRCPDLVCVLSTHGVSGQCRLWSLVRLVLDLVK